MKSFIVGLCFTVLFTVVVGQTNKSIRNEDTATFGFRVIVVTMDTTIEDPTDHFRPDKGLKITVMDNIFRLFHFAEYKNKGLNGISMEFYSETNMPKARGNYKNNQKDGEWIYWRSDGTLMRRESWRNGKLLTK